MGRWDQDKRPDVELLTDFRNLQLQLLHYKDRRKNALVKCEVEKQFVNAQQCIVLVFF